MERITGTWYEVNKKNSRAKIPKKVRTVFASDDGRIFVNVRWFPHGLINALVCAASIVRGEGETYVDSEWAKKEYAHLSEDIDRVLSGVRAAEKKK